MYGDSARILPIPDNVPLENKLPEMSNPEIQSIIPSAVNSQAIPNMPIISPSPSLTNLQKTNLPVQPNHLLLEHPVINELPVLENIPNEFYQDNAMLTPSVGSPLEVNEDLPQKLSPEEMYNERNEEDDLNEPESNLLEREKLPNKINLGLSANVYNQPNSPAQMIPENTRNLLPQINEPLITDSKNNLSGSMNNLPPPGLPTDTNSLYGQNLPTHGELLPPSGTPGTINLQSNVTLPSSSLPNSSNQMNIPNMIQPNSNPLETLERKLNSNETNNNSTNQLYNSQIRPRFEGSNSGQNQFN